MSTELRERLGQVAGLAPAAAPAPDLWRRGRRRQVRRALAGMAAVVLASVAAGVGGAAVWTRAGVDREPAPVEAPESGLVLLDRLFTPSPWLAGTDELGPGGPYVALLGAERSRWDGWRPSTSQGVVGVGVDGSYRFLDLPDRSTNGAGLVDATPRLSPDGRQLAYWTTGLSEGQPLLGASDDEPVGGVAVYDTVTGDVVRRSVTSEHGLSPQGVAWAGDVVRFQFGRYLDGGVATGGWGSRGRTQLAWDAESESWRATPGSGDGAEIGASGEGAGSLVGADNRSAGYVQVWPDGRHVRFRLDHAVLGMPVPSPSGGLVAAVWTADNNSQDGAAHQVLVADLGEGDATDGGRRALLTVPGPPTTEILGWRDERHLVVRSVDPGSGRILVVDVVTGETQPLTELPAQTSSMHPQVAARAWGAPLAEAPEPDWPLGTRQRVALVTGTVAGLILGGWLVVRLWRRRRGRA